MALSSEVIIAKALWREKMVQLMIWVRYNRIKKCFFFLFFFTLISALIVGCAIR